MDAVRGAAPVDETSSVPLKVGEAVAHTGLLSLSIDGHSSHHVAA